MEKYKYLVCIDKVGISIKYEMNMSLYYCRLCLVNT